MVDSDKVTKVEHNKDASTNQEIEPDKTTGVQAQNLVPHLPDLETKADKESSTNIEKKSRRRTTDTIPDS